MKPVGLSAAVLWWSCRSAGTEKLIKIDRLMDGAKFKAILEDDLLERLKV